MLFTSARMSSSGVFSFHTLSSPGARQTTECEWFAKRKSWRRAQGVDHSPCARGTQKRLEPLRHTCYHGVWRASTVRTHPAALTRQSCCSYAAVELVQNSIAKNCQKNGHSLAGFELVPRNNKKVFSDVYYTSALLSLHNHLS